MDDFGILIGWDCLNTTRRDVLSIITEYLTYLYDFPESKEKDKYKDYIKKYKELLNNITDDDIRRLEILMDCFKEHSIYKNPLEVVSNFIGVYMGNDVQIENIDEKYRELTVNKICRFLIKSLEKPRVLAVQN